MLVRNDSVIPPGLSAVSGRLKLNPVANISGRTRRLFAGRPAFAIIASTLPKLASLSSHTMSSWQIATFTHQECTILAAGSTECQRGEARGSKTQLMYSGFASGRLNSGITNGIAL